MVTFVCYQCDRTLKKNQVERHTQCRPLAVICIDCSTTFHGQDYKLHTSCMTQQQKYFGEFANKSKNKTKQTQQTQTKNIEKQQTKQVVMEVEGEDPPVWQWKNQIKRVIIEHDNKIEYEQLKRLILKKYTQYVGKFLSQDADKIFDEKVKKLSKVKFTTYVEL